MSRGSLSPARRVALSAVVIALSAGVAVVPADARAKHRGKEHAKHRVVHGPGYKPPYAEFVLDANSGQVMRDVNADEPRHPASLTKIMTLYMLFEQLEAGKFKLDTPLPISARAAQQPPTKLGLKANATITVEDAIKGMCTRSANDAAMVVGEAIGGTEEDFAKLMTEKARALGMANTTYVNASGLPAEEQVTTARDQAILGRAIQEKFPSYYKYFSTANFRFRGHDIHNHNSLLGNVKGVDGIKTGYTEASGYNLVTSVHRETRYLVSVVLGGRSNAARDSRMRELIEEFVSQASMQKTAPAGPELASQRNAPAPAPGAAPPVVAPEAPLPPAQPGEPAVATTDQPRGSEAVEQARAQVHPEKPQAPITKAVATTKISVERPRRSRAKAGAAGAPPPSTSSYFGNWPRDAW